MENEKSKTKTMAAVINHVKFINLRICNCYKLPSITDESFVNEFNHGFGEALNNIDDETDVFELEDIYRTALFTLMEFENENLTIRKMIVIIKDRLRTLRTLS